MSRHHIEAIIVMNIKDKYKGVIKFIWNQIIILEVIDNDENDAKIGHGLISTKWNGDFIIVYFLYSWKEYVLK